MADPQDDVLKAVRHYQECLERHSQHLNTGKLLIDLEKLRRLPIKVVHLELTGVGRNVNGLRKLGGDVGEAATKLVTKWKTMVVHEEEELEEEEEEEEDGYQSLEEEEEDEGVEAGSYEDNKDEEKSSANENLASLNVSDKKQTEDEKKESSSDSSKTEKKHKSDKHSEKHSSGSSHKHKSHKRKPEDEDDKTSKKHRSLSLSLSTSSLSSHSKKNHHKSEKKESSNSKKHEDKPKEKRDKKEKAKDSKKEKVEVKKTKVTGGLNGIDSGSGASFAEALGMCEPPSSTPSSKTKKKPASVTPSSSERRVKKTKEDPVPKLLKESNLEPLDINIKSLLPTITPNYRPLGDLIVTDVHPKRAISEYEALSNIITSKNQRTKVYSGNKIGGGKVPSLFEMCVRILQDNIDALEYTGGVPYLILKPILEKATANQLFLMEHHNPYLIADTDDLWQLHCQKDFRNKSPEELESWREMYMRCLDEREAKLKALTANIKQSQDKSLPVRTTKLAYVDSVVKPPREILRKQAKNGTAFDKRPTVTPTSRLASLATSGEAGKIAVPNPGARAGGSSQMIKPKKAPLMAKSLSLLKNRFRR